MTPYFSSYSLSSDQFSVPYSLLFSYSPLLLSLLYGLPTPPPPLTLYFLLHSPFLTSYSPPTPHSINSLLAPYSSYSSSSSFYFTRFSIPYFFLVSYSFPSHSSLAYFTLLSFILLILTLSFTSSLLLFLFLTLLLLTLCSLLFLLLNITFLYLAYSYSFSSSIPPAPPVAPPFSSSSTPHPLFLPPLPMNNEDVSLSSSFYCSVSLINVRFFFLPLPFLFG